MIHGVDIRSEQEHNPYDRNGGFCASVIVLKDGLLAEIGKDTCTATA